MLGFETMLEVDTFLKAHGAHIEYSDEEIAAQRKALQGALLVERIEEKFRSLANQWRRETRYVSSITQRTSNVSYLKIIAMGWSAVPLLLRELEKNRDHWIWALYIITGQDPAEGIEIYDDAVEAWLTWGKQNHYL